MFQAKHMPMSLELELEFLVCIVDIEFIIHFTILHTLGVGFSTSGGINTKYYFLYIGN